MSDETLVAMDEATMTEHDIREAEAEIERQMILDSDAPEWAPLKNYDADHLVRCNSCGWVRRKSEATPCPKGHEVGWSYAGEIPEPPDSAFEADADAEPIAEDAPEEEGPPESELASELDSIAVEQAIVTMFEVQDKLDAALDDAAEKADVAKTAKKRVESLQEDLSLAVRRVREARSVNSPDPERFPLFDRPDPAAEAKAAVNGLFSKPDSVQPLPPDTAIEFHRRKARDTRLDTLGLPSRAVKALEKAGYVTVADIAKLTEASAPLTSVKGVGEQAAGEIAEAMANLSDAWVEEWRAMNPAGEVGDA